MNNFEFLLKNGTNNDLKSFCNWFYDKTGHCLTSRTLNDLIGELNEPYVVQNVFNDEEKRFLLKAREKLGGLKYLARDEDGDLYFFGEKPLKAPHPISGTWTAPYDSLLIKLQDVKILLREDGAELAFKSIKWEDDDPVDLDALAL